MLQPDVKLATITLETDGLLKLPYLDIAQDGIKRFQNSWYTTY